MNATSRNLAGLSLAIAFGLGLQSQAQAQAPDDRARAIALFRDHADIEALPILERLHAASPGDREVKEMLACSLVRVSALAPEDEARATLRRARTMLDELKAGGKTLGDLAESLASMIAADGKLPHEVARKEVADAIKAGERAFVRRDFPRARAAYELAHSLDPKEYRVVVFIGDTWFAEGKPEKACPWFEKAVALDPNRDVAYRYWGDALGMMGKHAEARDKFLRAIVGMPDSRPAWISLGQWARANKVVLSHPRLLPESPGDAAIKAAPAADGTARLAGMGEVRRAWRDRLFREKYPAEAAYRPTLAEETDVLRTLARELNLDMKAGKIKALDPALANLVKLDSEGLIEPWVLFNHLADPVVEDYAAYRDKNRDTLMRYLADYVAPLTDGAK